MTCRPYHDAASAAERPQRRYIRPGELLAVDPAIVAQDGPRAFFWLFGPPVYHNQRIGDVSVVRISGPLDYHDEYFGDSYECIATRVHDALTGEDVVKQKKLAIKRGETLEEPGQPEPPKVVVLRIDSPGGVVAGLHQTVTHLRRMAEKAGIPLIAYVDEMAYSAAYALSCACSAVILPPSGFLGSIGVISTMVDQTERDKKDGYRFVVLTSGARKADGHPHVPITDDMIDAERPRIARLARFFFKDVRKARGLSIGDIRGFEASRFLGVDAVRAGLADDVMGWTDLLRALKSGDYGAADENEDAAGGE